MNKTVVHFYLFCILYIQIKGTKLSVSREGKCVIIHFTIDFLKIIKMIQQLLTFYNQSIIVFFFCLSKFHPISTVHNAFQTYFNPIEVGTNSSLEVKFIIIFPGEVSFFFVDSLFVYIIWCWLSYKQRFVGKYDFTTRNHSHAQWTGNFLITHNDYVNEKHVNFKQSQFKSVFIDGKVYVDSLSFDPKIAFLQDFLLKGPQIQSMMDQLMKHVSKQTRFSSEGTSENMIWQWCVVYSLPKK